MHASPGFRRLAAVLLLAAGACGGDGGGQKSSCTSAPTAPCSGPSTNQANAPGTGLVFADSSSFNSFYAAAAPYSGASSLPASVDLSADLPTPGDQGQQNSCVGWATAYGMMTYLERAAHKWALSSATVFSPAYVYNQLNHGIDAGITVQ